MVCGGGRASLILPASLLRTDERDALGSPAEEDAVFEMWLLAWPKHHEQSHAVQSGFANWLLLATPDGINTPKKGEMCS